MNVNRKLYKFNIAALITRVCIIFTLEFPLIMLIHILKLQQIKKSHYLYLTDAATCVKKYGQIQPHSKQLRLG